MAANVEEEITVDVGGFDTRDPVGIEHLKWLSRSLAVATRKTARR